jgi:hypothetical protein
MPEYISTSKSWLVPLAALAALMLFLHPPAPAQTKKSGLVAGGEAPDLIMLYTGDVIGYIDPCG